MTFSDSDIALRGHVGYADRDQARADAEAMAQRLAELLDQDYATLPEIEELIGMADRGQYDPAFAVALSEAIGVDGYVDATELIRLTYSQQGNVVPDGLAAVEVLAATMTAALDTLPRGIGDEYLDPSNEALPSGERLGAEFATALSTDYRPPDAVAEQDLSVLLSFAKPPTTVAVAIADSRLTPRLHDNAYDGMFSDTPGGISTWGDERSGIITNYATMLSRDQEASALWLDGNSTGGDSNLAAVLGRDGSHEIDSGAALAEVVENGLTYTQPGTAGLDLPPYPDQWPLGAKLMNEAIEVVGGDLGEIPNPNMYEALASGFESNMDVIVHRATLPLEAEDPTLKDTHAFVRELMGDEEAGARVYSATLEFVHDELAGSGTGSVPGHVITDIGRVTSLVTEAEINAAVGDAEDQVARRQAYIDGFERAVDSAIGLLPGGGTASSLGKDALGWAADDLLGKAGDDASVSQALADAAGFRQGTELNLMAGLANREYTLSDMTSASVLESVSVDAGSAGDFFGGDVSDPKRPLLPLGEILDDPAKSAAYRTWLGSDDIDNRLTDVRTQIHQASDDVQDLVSGQT